jgi:hypothetical protein
VTEIYYNETAKRWVNGDTGLFAPTPECSDCGDLLSPDDVVFSITDGTMCDERYRGTPDPAYTEGEVLQCRSCYRDMYGSYGRKLVTG